MWSGVRGWSRLIKLLIENHLRLAGEGMLVAVAENVIGYRNQLHLTLRSNRCRSNLTLPGASSGLWYRHEFELSNCISCLAIGNLTR